MDYGINGSRLTLGSLLGKGIKSLLIKGAPGSGKTTLALELINGNGGGAYISTRGDQNRLITHFPNLEGFKGSDTSQRGQSKVSNEFSDLTLASPSDIIEELLRAIRKPEGVLLVLDAWDAIAKEMDSVDRLRAERTMVAAINATEESKLVLVSEEPQLTTTDYLVDGVVHLNDKEFEGRRIREMCVSKLRGTLIPQSEYLFSLQDGKFNMISPISIPQPRGQVSQKYEPVPDNGSMLSTGSVDLDLFLGGGLQRGSYIVLELGPTLGPEWHLPLLATIRINWLLNGRGVFAIPTAGVTPEAVKRYLIPYVDPDVLEKGLRIGSYGYPSSDACLFDIPNSSGELAFKTSLEKIEEIKRNTKGPIFSSVGLDSIVMQFGIESVKKTLSASAQVARVKGDVRIHIAKPESELTQYASDICNLHLRLEEIHGAMVLFSKKPPSILYAVSYDYSNGLPKVVLTPNV